MSELLLESDSYSRGPGEKWLRLELGNSSKTEGKERKNYLWCKIHRTWEMVGSEGQVVWGRCWDDLQSQRNGRESLRAKTGGPGTLLLHLRCVWASPGQRPPTSHSSRLELNFWGRWGRVVIWASPAKRWVFTSWQRKGPQGQGRGWEAHSPGVRQGSLISDLGEGESDEEQAEKGPEGAPRAGGKPQAIGWGEERQ